MIKWLVVINVAHKLVARLPFPNPYEIINVGDAIGFKLDWPTSLVILETEHPQCPRQERGFECGYFVMRFIQETIFYPTIIASKFGDKKTYSQVEFNEIRGEWTTFVLQLIMNHVDAS
ncbi:hypothetical protein CK203_106753 [Vitis vinifera]|uniref:Ubiquitin-like protease family profile domain-containing protein n=1 Tax=Vitis vinifera TaxID=29760 RepID=A0A438BVE8_VITVI|nr:hypothetical protein CK203_106753 [Vitis vinifera]